MPELTIQQAIDLAMQHHTAGDIETADKIYRQILQVDPNNVDAWNNLGVALQQRRNWREAEVAFHRAIQLKPTFANAYGNLGECLRTQRRLDEACKVLARACELEPNSGDLQYNYGTALDDAKRHDEAIAALQKAIQLRPGYALAHVNLAAALMARDRYSEGVTALQHALELDPNNPMAANNIAHAYLKTGRPDEAVDMFRRAAELDGKKDLSYPSNALLAMHYTERLDPEKLFAAHAEFGREAQVQRPPMTGRPEDRTASRRPLRIGYVSADLCRHSVAFFIEPILREHERRGFEVTCYNDTVAPDNITVRIRSVAQRWVDTATLQDDELAQRIAADRIDILVDLAGHTARNRMGTFLRRPAPVQVTYLGYPNTTGLPTMDYRITDTVADPPGQTERFHIEKLYRLPRPAWCYQPAPDSPAVALELPVKRKGHFTFGCLNAMMKMSPPLMQAWSRILDGVAGSRLIIKTGALRDDEARKRMHDSLVAAGIDPERFVLMPPIENYAQHLSVYNDIDVALDTYPYNGTTTTCDALWMGVPVVTLAGDIHVSRVGASLLGAVGLGAWVTDSYDSYVARAISAANDVATESDLRGKLRATMRRSTIMDAAGLTRELERAYITMWESYCGVAPSAP